MKITNLRWIVVFSALVLASSACSSNTSLTPPPTRAVTQTPWIIEKVITTTPEPVIVTPLPPATEAKVVRTPTKAPTAKPVAVAKSPTAPPVAVVPTATSAPACNLGSVTLLFPENGAPRNTRPDGSGGSAFIFKWTPFQAGDSDTQTGYRIIMESRRGSSRVNGATVYVSHNKFLKDGQQYIYDQRAVSSLAGGDNATVTWNVTVVKTNGSFDDQGNVTGTVATCGTPSATWTIQLLVP